MNLMLEVARKKLAKGSDWQMTKWQRVGDSNDSIVSGAVPIGAFKSGPRKGRPKFPKEKDVCVVTAAEMEIAQEQWEAATGQCHPCNGTGQEWAGWSSESGDRHRPCSRCKATGNRPMPKVSP